MFCSLPRSGTYRSKTYCMEKAFDFLKANKAVAFATVEGQAENPCFRGYETTG